MDQFINFSKKIIKNILYMAKVAGSNSSHIGGALSCVDLISVLFQNTLILKILTIMREIDLF